MIRPIDGNALFEQEKEWAKDGGFYTSIYNGFQKRIQDAPTLDYAPVRHGEWVGLEFDGYADGYPVYDLWECSECKGEHKGEYYTLTDYCPECGAKMDGKKGE